MAQIDEKQIEEIVSQVLRTLQQDRPTASQPIAVLRVRALLGQAFLEQ